MWLVFILKIYWRGAALKVDIVTSSPDDPGAPVGGVEAASVNLIQVLAEFEDLNIHVMTTRRACTSPIAVRGEKLMFIGSLGGEYAPECGWTGSVADAGISGEDRAGIRDGVDSISSMR